MNAASVTWWWLPWLLVANAAVPAAAFAEAARDRAANAYERGARALELGDFAAAARHFEEAHDIQPSDVAREQAIACYTRSNEPWRAASLALQAPSQHVALLAAAARDQARLELRCDGCALEVDGERTPRAELFVAPGAHRVRAHFAHGSVQRRFQSAAGQSVVLELHPPAPPMDLRAEPRTQPSLGSARPARPGPDAEGSGLSPAVSYVLAAATTISIGTTVWSLLDLGTAADRYDVALAVARDAPSATSVARADDALGRARSAQARTHLLLGATGALGTATAVVALFFTDWGGALDQGPLVAVGRASVQAGWRQRW